MEVNYFSGVRIIGIYMIVHQALSANYTGTDDVCE